jgi:GntR family transcriptional regulator
VRDALDMLRREGLIERLQGTGTLVIAARDATQLMDIHGVVTPAPGGFVRGLSPRVIEQSVIPMPRPVAAALGESEGTPCLLLEYAALSGDQVTALCTNYLRFPEADRVAATPFLRDWYTLLKDAALGVTETDLLMEATLADEELAEALGVEPGAAVLTMEQVIRDDDGRPYDFAVLRCRGDRLSLFSRATRRPYDPAAGERL